jgi:putative transposase
LYRLLKPEMAGTGRDKLFDILKRHCLLINRRRRFVRTTRSNHLFRKYSNVLRALHLSAPNQAYVSDITYIRVGSGFAYLFLITDAWSRKIVGWWLSPDLGIEGGLKALRMALRQCPSTRGMVHHSDRGIQYCCYAYTGELAKHGIIISMTEDQHCYENAIAERVNGILKEEYLLGQRWPDYRMAKLATAQAIELYNNRRPHWSLNLKTPNQVHIG